MVLLRSSGSIAGRIRSTRLKFWIRRYLPPGIVGIIAMVLAAELAARVTTSTPVIVFSALLAEALGCSFVIGMTVYREQWVLWAGNVRPRARSAVRITTRQLADEFGAIGLVGLLVLRPLLLVGGVAVVGDITAGLIVGKIAADATFYAIEAVTFTMTSRSGLREVPETLMFAKHEPRRVVDMTTDDCLRRGHAAQ
jgi:hypothetical protein